VIVGATTITFERTAVERTVVVHAVVGARESTGGGTALVVTLARFAGATVIRVALTAGARAGARDVGAIAAIPAFQLTAAVLVILSAEPTFVAATIQWAIVVVAVVITGNRTGAVSPTLTAVVTGTTERDRALGGSAPSAHERDNGRQGPAQPAHRLAPRALAADRPRQPVKTLFLHGHPPMCPCATGRKPTGGPAIHDTCPGTLSPGMILVHTNGCP
jgi:hypothetical protein